MKIGKEPLSMQKYIAIIYPLFFTIALSSSSSFASTLKCLSSISTTVEVSFRSKFENELPTGKYYIFRDLPLARIDFLKELQQPGNRSYRDRLQEYIDRGELLVGYTRKTSGPRMFNAYVSEPFNRFEKKVQKKLGNKKSIRVLIFNAPLFGKDSSDIGVIAHELVHLDDIRDGLYENVKAKLQALIGQFSNAPDFLNDDYFAESVATYITEQRAYQKTLYVGNKEVLAGARLFGDELKEGAQAYLNQYFASILSEFEYASESGSSRDLLTDIGSEIDKIIDALIGIPAQEQHLLVHSLWFELI